MKKIYQILNSIAKDRWMHFTIGTVSALWLLLAGCLLNFWFGIALSVVGCIALAFGKEYYDHKQDNVFDCIDFIATVFGGIQVWVVACLICKWGW
ncbi:MAG: hypothetical protein RSA66_06525 [Muribaculaceae bacterium]